MFRVVPPLKKCRCSSLPSFTSENSEKKKATPPKEASCELVVLCPEVINCHPAMESTPQVQGTVKAAFYVSQSSSAFCCVLFIDGSRQFFVLPYLGAFLGNPPLLGFNGNLVNTPCGYGQSFVGALAMVVHNPQTLHDHPYQPQVQLGETEWHNSAILVSSSPLCTHKTIAPSTFTVV